MTLKNDIMIKNSIFFLLFLGSIVFSGIGASIKVEGIWVLKSINGEENPRLNGSYIRFLDNGWFIMGSINKESNDKGRWVCALNKKVMFFYTKPKTSDKILSETEIVRIKKITKDTLIIQMKKKVFEFINLKMEPLKVQEAFKLKKVVLSKDILEKKRNLTGQEHKYENNETPEGVTNEILDSKPLKNKASKEARMEIVAKVSTLIGKWKITAINLDFVIKKSGIESKNNDIGYIDFKKDGSFIMKINNKQIPAKKTQWVLAEDINTIFQYVLNDEDEVDSKVEFYKINELYDNKMTLWAKPLSGFIYLEKMGTE